MFVTCYVCTYVIYPDVPILEIDLKDLTPMALDSLLGKRQLLRHDDSSHDESDSEPDIEMNRDRNKVRVLFSL